MDISHRVRLSPSCSKGAQTHKRRALSAGADTCCKGEHWATYSREVIVMLTETYSASTLTISGLIFCFDRSHDLILFSLLSWSALKIAHQPSVPSELLRKL